MPLGALRRYLDCLTWKACGWTKPCIRWRCSRLALRRDAAQSERRADPAGRALEVRLQEHQIHREDRLRRKTAADHLDHGDAERVWLLFEREPERRPPALEPGQRAAHRRVLRKRKTLPFNGYADQVASLYAGMDLRKNY